MPIVEGLVIAHLGATALLLLVFALVVLCQRLARALERRPDVRPGALGEGSAAGVSVLDWTIDLRGPQEVDARLQPS